MYKDMDIVTISVWKYILVSINGKGNWGDRLQYTFKITFSAMHKIMV